MDGRNGPIGLWTPGTDGGTGVDLGRRSLQTWLESLPLSDAGASAGPLVARLAGINRQRAEARERFDALELLRPVAQEIAATLQADSLRPSARGIPLPEAQALQRELSDGYKLVAEAQAGSRSLFQDRILVPTALQRALYHLSERLTCAWRRYDRLPARTWLDIHRIYDYATREGHAATRIKDAMVPGTGETSIEDTYKRILLLALANPYALRPQTLERLQQQLWLWSDSARIQGPYGRDGLFQITLGLDLPPTHRYTDPQPGEDTRILDTTELVQRLERLLSQGEHTASPQPLSGTTLRHLIHAWGEQPVRRFPRAERVLRLEVVLGLSTTHGLLERQETQGRGRGAGTGSGGAGNPVLRRSEIPVRSGDGQPTGTAGRICSTLDVSLGGYCLRWEGDRPPGLQVGEVVALSRPDNPVLSRRWYVGVVRWLQQSRDGALAVGVELLAPGARPLELRRLRQGENAALLKGLLLPELRNVGQPASLLLPGSGYHGGEPIELRREGFTIRVRLHEGIAGSDSYRQFTFEFDAGPPAEGDTLQAFR
ncbi:hypothetical protein [Thioalbus denitrificans]|uniref:PilZ domain-containing protein n=1 Tax=Thioalbus denitrificans TaxID=547122 RepID=A0A369BXV7_9GAMM|nr:hypothetical protein [Thioalbus denitrificans]RCX26161.1 hypothetical protein DFQ59_11135 [Thioalbus denitrificans]